MLCLLLLSELGGKVGELLTDIVAEFGYFKNRLFSIFSTYDQSMMMAQVQGSACDTLPFSLHLISIIWFLSHFIAFCGDDHGYLGPAHSTVLHFPPRLSFHSHCISHSAIL